MAPEFDKLVPPITRRSLIKTAAAGAALAGTGALSACVASGGTTPPGGGSSSAPGSRPRTTRSARTRSCRSRW